MIFNVLTLFPEMIREAASHSILGRGIRAGHIALNCVNIRDFAVNKHGQVDDSPYGGGAGMVMMAPPVYDAYKHVISEIAARVNAAGSGIGHQCESGERHIWPKNLPPVFYLSPQGRVFNQKLAEKIAVLPEIILLCGHYEGIDERIIEEIVTDEISIGDYVLTGGEPAAIVIMDAVSRLVPGVLGKAESYKDESFTDGLLEYPHYTRPPVFRGRDVPPVLLSGHHGQIDAWRRQQSLARTKEKRPDLLRLIPADIH